MFWLFSFSLLGLNNLFGRSISDTSWCGVVLSGDFGRTCRLQIGRNVVVPENRVLKRSSNLNLLKPLVKVLNWRLLGC